VASVPGAASLPRITAAASTMFLKECTTSVQRRVFKPQSDHHVHISSKHDSIMTTAVYYFAIIIQPVQ